MFTEFENVYEQMNKSKPSFKERMDKMLTEWKNDDEISDILLQMEEEGFDSIRNDLADMDQTDKHRLLVGLLSDGRYDLMKLMLDNVDMN